MRRKKKKIVITTKRERFNNFMFISVFIASFALSLYLTYFFYKTFNVGHLKIIEGLYAGKTITDNNIIYSNIFTGIYYVFLIIISFSNAAIISSRHDM